MMEKVVGAEGKEGGEGGHLHPDARSEVETY